MPRWRLADAALRAALVTTPIVAVLLLADSAREHDGVSAQVDPRVAADVVDARTTVLTGLARLLTLIGSEAVVGALALLLVTFLLKRRGRFVAGAAAAAMATSAALTVGVKVLVERTRPGAVDRLGPVDASYSFPSGHTLNSTVFLGLVALLVIPMVRARRRRIVAVVGCIVLATAIGLSRIYLGYHWTTDVVAAWLIAIAILALVHVAIAVDDGRNRAAVPVGRRSGPRS